MIEVVCAVMVREDRVLLCKRRRGAHLAGHWEFPGGKVEAGETPVAAVRREIEEELGCRVSPGQGLEAVVHSYSADLIIRLVPYLCTIEEGEPEALEHDEIGWFGDNEVEGIRLAEADRLVWSSFKASA